MTLHESPAVPQVVSSSSSLSSDDASDVPVPAAPSRQGKIARRLQRSWPSLLALVCLMAAWQYLPGALDVKHYVMPTPTRVLDAIQRNGEGYITAIQVTALRATGGFLLSGVIGVAIAILMASFHFVRRILYPYIVVLHTVPIVAIAPLIIIWFGTGTNAILIISFLIGLFPVVVNTFEGLISTSATSVDLFRVYRASRVQTMFKLRLASAQPSIMTGLKVSCTLCVIGAIVGEYLAGSGGARGGLGYALVVSINRLETDYLFACAIAAGLMGIVFYFIVSLLAKRLLGSWHDSAIADDH